MESGPLFYTGERTVKGINAEKCSEGQVGVLCMPVPALIQAIVFVLCNHTEIQSDVFKVNDRLHPTVNSV